MAGARAVLAAFTECMQQWLTDGGEVPALDLAGLDAEALRVLNETLGEGDVCATVDADHEIRIQETVFAGVWRQQHLHGSRLLHDFLLAAPIPPLVAARAEAAAAKTLRALPLPAGAMNVPPLLHELQQASDRCAADRQRRRKSSTDAVPFRRKTAHLDAVLDGGAVVVLSRGSQCRISSTAARHVWRVQYFNNMQS